MDITTFSTLIDICNAEDAGEMTAEGRGEAEKFLKDAGLLESVDYKHLTDTLNLFKIYRTSVYTSLAGAIDSMFDKDFSAISAEDWGKISTAFSDNIGTPDSNLALPSITGMGFGIFDEAIEVEAGQNISQEDFEFSRLFGNRTEVAPESVEGLLYETENDDSFPSDLPDAPDTHSNADEYAIWSDNGMTLTDIFYTLTGSITAGVDKDAMGELLKETVESAGADWDKFYTVAEETEKKLEADDFTLENWEKNTPEFVTRVAVEFRSRYEDIFAGFNDREPLTEAEREKELEKTVLTLGSSEVSLYIHTDSSLEDLTATGAVDEEGRRKLREVTSTATFDDNFLPDDRGIFSQKLFGPLSGQRCSCGKCNGDEPIDGKQEAVCPSCHEPIMTSRDRNTAYAVVRSPFPLLMGRNSLIAAMLDDKEWNYEDGKQERHITPEEVVDLFESCSARVFYSVSKSENGEETGKICCYREGEEIPPLQEGESRIYGTHGLEAALQSMAGKTIEYEKGKREWPLALYNAIEKVKYWDGKQRPYLGDAKDDFQARDEAQRKWMKAVNNYHALRLFLLDRAGDPADLLLHYLLITPPNTRPLNNRNSTTDYGEVNKALMPMIKDLLLAGDLMKTGDMKREEFLKLEKDYAKHAAVYTQIARDDVNKKNKLIYSQLMTVKADNIVRAVISPSDHLDGQKWYRENTGLEIPQMDLIGMPRSLARNMYRTEIYKLLKTPGIFKEKPEGYMKEEIDTAYLTPPNTMETLSDGTVRRCLIDRALEEVMINRDPKTKKPQGQIVSYNRQPIITNGSIQAGYAYLHDGETLLIAAERTKALNADFDGDQMMAIKAVTKEAREELKRHMNQTIFDDSTGELLVGPKLESLIGLYKMSSPAETYTFGRDVIINRESLEQYEGLGYFSSGTGRMTATKPLYVNHVVAEIDTKEIKPAKKDGETITAGEPYAFLSDGMPFIAEEDLVIKSEGGKTYAVTPFKDYVMVPQGSVIDTKNLFIPEGKKVVSKVFTVAEDAVEITRGLESGFLTYNQPVTLFTEDGEEKKTTPGRVALERVFGHSINFYEDRAFGKKDWNRLLTEEIESIGRDRGKDVVSRLVQFGFNAVNYTQLTQTLNDFPTTQRVDPALFYSDDDEKKANKSIFGEETVEKALEREKEKAREIVEGERIPGEDDSRLMRAMVAVMKREGVAKAEAERVYNDTLNYLIHCRDAEINEIRAKKYEPLVKENAKLVKEQYSFYKNNFLKDSIEAGVKGWGLVTSMVDKEVTRDYQGLATAVGGGSMVHGMVGLERVMNDSTAPINGNKTIGVAEIGGISNYTVAPAMADMKFFPGDCGTTHYETAYLGGMNFDIEKMKKKLDGRILAKDLFSGNGTGGVKLAEKGEMLTAEKIQDVYVKGVRRIPYRSALGCLCDGTCEVCAGKIPGNTPAPGASIGITARQALIAPSYQGVMNRAKAAGEGTKDQKGYQTMKALLSGKRFFQTNRVSGAYGKKYKEQIPVFELATRMRDSFYEELSYEQFPPVYAELVSKAFVRRVDKYGMPSTLSETLRQGRVDVHSKQVNGVVVSNPGMFINSEIGYLAKDQECTRFGAYRGSEAKDLPLIRHDTVFEKKDKAEGQIARTLATAVAGRTK